jgi:hypothetical protein
MWLIYVIMRSFVHAGVVAEKINNPLLRSNKTVEIFVSDIDISYVLY